MSELLQVKGKGRRRDTETFRDDAGGKPFRAAGHQKAEQRQPGLLREGPERSNRVFLIH